MRAVLAILVTCAIAAPAWAQSTRYPPVPVDPDREDAKDSQLWNHAIDPARAPYCDDLTAARRALEQRTTDETVAAIAILDRAIASVPDAPEAYAKRGMAYLELQRWVNCADDLQAAEDRAAHASSCTAPPVEPKVEQRRALGICQARAGRLSAAERTLAPLAASAGTNADLWVRLGETRIAMGKLDEAVAALTEALRTSEPSQQGFMRWLLMVAHDRARRPSDAHDEALIAMGTDRGHGTIMYPTVPLIGVGETEYMLALAYEANDMPEQALMYFRRFVSLAPQSPWRRRAEEHLRELQRNGLPVSIARTRGNASVDTATALAIVQRAMPAMRACMAKLPSVVLEVQVTRAGARTPDSARDHPHVWGAPAGITITTQLDLDTVDRALLDAAYRCIEPIATKLALPPVKDRDTWYQLGFVVIAP